MHLVCIFRDGLSLDAEPLLRLSGARLPSFIVTKSNAAHLLFTSDDTGVRTGFQLNWEPALEGKFFSVYKPVIQILFLFTNMYVTPIYIYICKPYIYKHDMLNGPFIGTLTSVIKSLFTIQDFY